MLKKLQIQEIATEKFLEIEDISLGVLFVIKNTALKDRMFLGLDLEDMKAVVALLQNRIQEVELAMKG